MRLKAKKSQKKYKSTTAYIDAVYRKNKEYIDKNIGLEWLAVYKNPKTAFRNLVKERMMKLNYNTGKGYTVDQSIKFVQNSKDLHRDWTTQDVIHNNFRNIIQKDKNIAKEFRKRTRDERGKFTSYDAKKLHFEGYYTTATANAAVYSYGDLYLLEYKSPDKETGASLQLMNKYDFESALGKTIFFQDKSKRGRY